MADAELFEDLLQPILLSLHLRLTPDQLGLLERHYRTLRAWSARLNLTALRDPAAVVRRHFGESLLAAVKLPTVKTVADLGSGPGFPGFPVAVVRSELTVTLVESVTKKAAFLKEISRDVPNARVVRGRFEDLTDRFDWVLSRAVSITSLQANLARLTDGVSILTRKASVMKAVESLALHEHRVDPIPWDPSFVLLQGTFHVKHSLRERFT